MYQLDYIGLDENLKISSVTADALMATKTSFG